MPFNPRQSRDAHSRNGNQSSVPNRTGGRRLVPSPHPDRTSTPRSQTSPTPVRGVSSGQPFPLGRGFQPDWTDSATYLNPEWVEAERFHAQATSPQTDHIDTMRIRARSMGRWRWWSAKLSPLELGVCSATALLTGFISAGGSMKAALIGVAIAATLYAFARFFVGNIADVSRSIEGHGWHD